MTPTRRFTGFVTPWSRKPPASAGGGLTCSPPEIGVITFPIRERSAELGRSVMDQIVELSAGNRKPAIEALGRFVVNSVDTASAFETPFFHLVFDRVFPDDIYAAMLAAMPEASDYRPMHGRSKGHDLADGTHTRVKIDLFPEYIRHLPPQKRALWDMVGRALCTRAVKEVFMRRLAAPLERRFGARYAKVGMYPIPILTRDIP